MDPNNLNTPNKINTSNLNTQKTNASNRNAAHNSNTNASTNANANTANKTNSANVFTPKSSGSGTHPHSKTVNSSSSKQVAGGNHATPKDAHQDSSQVSLRDFVESNERNEKPELRKFNTIDTTLAPSTDRTNASQFTPCSSSIPYLPCPAFAARDDAFPDRPFYPGIDLLGETTDRQDPDRIDGRDWDKDAFDEPTPREDSVENGTIGMTERRGGLSWIRTNNGNLLPQIENTWLKHIITSLQTNKTSLMNFFNNLERCLIESVQFLYREGIKPYLGDVANQMKRSICDNFWSAAEVAYVSLHCKNAVRLQIELRVKGEMGWVVYLLNEPHDFRGFVDTHSTVNCYSDYYWRQLNQFASSILATGHSSNSSPPSSASINSENSSNDDMLAAKEKEERDFNGGRYAFAERLKNEVDAFKDMRLGEVVHLVQLAIYSGIFVYAQRILLPVAACEKTAQELFPKLKKSRYPICTCINEVLKIVSLLVDGRRNGLVLAQLKQQFMLQFNRELNPLSFGYRKLQNLLLSDLFSSNYHLFVPVDSPHRTHIQHKRYPIPPGCKIFRQSKLQFDPNKFPNPLTDFYDQYHSICPIHTPNSQARYFADRGLNLLGPGFHVRCERRECVCVWRIEFTTLPRVVQDSIRDYLE